MFRCKPQISLCLLGWLGVFCLSPGAAGEDPRILDEYLSRLGLVELRLHHSERTLQRETDPAKRAALAQALVDQYAEQLIAAGDDTDRFEHLKTRVERLLETVPQARTPALNIVLLQADYQRAESLILVWQEERAAGAPPDEAREILERIEPVLAELQAGLTNAADKQAEAIDGLPTEQARQAAEKELAKQRALAARADYFAGWSAYYLGLLRVEAVAADADYASSKQHFLRLLDATDEKDYTLVDAGELGLESVWRSRAAIGLGLAELGLRRLPAAERVFSWLSHPSVTPTIRDQAGYWQLQGLVNAKQWNAAAVFVAGQVSGFASTPSSGKVSLCMTAVRSAATGTSGEDQRRLLAAGVQGLARMRQFDAIEKLVQKHDLNKLLPGDFTLLWLKGRQQYLAAEKSKDDVGFRAAAQALQAALQSKDARQELVAAGQARYYLAWSRFRLDELDAAAQLFREAASTLRGDVPEVAIQAAWMHCTCLVKRAERDPRQAAAAIAALAAFKQEFPSSTEAQQVDLLVARLRQSDASPEQSIRDLAKIKPDEPTYLSAQLEICQLQHQVWSKVKSDDAKVRELAKDVSATAERVLTASGASAEQRLKAALLASDVLSRGSSPDWTKVGALLNRVGSDAEKLAESSAARVEYEYRRLELAQSRRDEREAQQAAEWIGKHGQGSAYELPALVLVARAADQALQKATSEERGARLSEAHGVYERLVRLLGESKQTLTNSKNALAAASTLAQYDEQAGRWPEAAERLNRLVEAFPSDRRLRRRGGIANFQAGNYEAALPHWRTLLAGLTAGSEEWFEAKYYQLACLEKTDRPAAQKVLSQFHVLYPEVKSALWKPKFEALSQSLQ